MGLCKEGFRRLKKILYNIIQLIHGKVNFHAAKLGLDCIEWVFEYPNYDKNALFLENGAESIIDLSKLHDVNVNSVVADYFMVKKLFCEKDEDLNLNINIFYELIRKCSMAGIPIIEVPLVDSSSMRNSAEKREVIKNLLPLIDYAQELNIKISIESDLEPTLFKNFITDFNHNNIFINYDMGNSASLGYDAQEEIDLLGNKIINVHIKDRIRNGTTVPLGTGDTDFKRVFGALKSINYSSDFIFQSARQDIHTDSPKDYIGVMKEYINLIEKLFIVNVLIIGLGGIGQRYLRLIKKILKNRLYML